MPNDQREDIIDSLATTSKPDARDTHDDSYVPPPQDWSGLDTMSEAMGADGDPPVIPTTETPPVETTASPATEQPVTQGTSAAADVAQSPDAMTRLRNEAQSLGFRPDDVTSLDAANLAALVETHRRLAIQGAPAQQFAPPQPQFQQPQPGQWQYAPPPQFQQYPGQPGQPPAQVQFTPYAPPNPETFTEEAVQYFDGLNKHYAQQTAALAQQNQMLLQQQIQRDQASQQQAAAWENQRVLQREYESSREFDRWIEQQGPAFEPIFGKGDSVLPNSPQVRVRDQVWRAAEAMQQRSLAAGVTPDMTWIRNEAAKQVLGQQYEFFQQQAAKNPSGQRPQQATMRANGRGVQAKAPSYEERKRRAGDFAEDYFRNLEAAQ